MRVKYWGEVGGLVLCVWVGGKKIPLRYVENAGETSAAAGHFCIMITAPLLCFLLF